MFSMLLNAALFLISTAAPTAASGPMSRVVKFSKASAAETIRHDAAEVTLQPIADDRDADAIDVAATVRVPNYPAVTVREGVATSRHYDRWIGIGRLAASDPAPSVLLAGFSGGAHCCATLIAIVPHEGRLRVLEFEAVDGEPDEAFPRDVDLDGVVDFVRQDDSLRYAFAGGGGSWSPPIVFNIQQGRIVDVTTRPEFRDLSEDYVREARVHCTDQSNESRNGACAAYVAVAARLGRYDQAMREVESLARTGADIILPEGCSVALINGECPAGHELTFQDFPSALRWFLRAHGYID